MIAALVLSAAVVCQDIPFRWTPGQIEVQVSVNHGPPAWFILDSGAERSIVRDDFGTNGRGVTLQIGGVTLANQDVMVMPLDNFKAQHRDIRGLIGYDFFASRAVTIDYAKKIVSACNAARPPLGAVMLPLTFAGRLPVVPVALTLADGRELRLQAMIDTGASQLMIVRHSFASAHGVDGKAAAAAPSLFGPASMKTVAARNIRIGPFTIETPSVKLFATGDTTETDALIGNALLQRFRVTFDYPRRRLLLSAASPPR